MLESAATGGATIAPHADVLSRALSIATDAALAAGELIRADFHRAGGPRGSGDHADVDIEAERLIRARLSEAFPEWGYRGEETGSAGVDPPPRFLWLVDPNDGTRSYLLGTRGSAVSIALLRDREPVLGVVYAPCAPDSGGDLITWAEGCGPLLRNGEPVIRTEWPSTLRPHDVILVSMDADAPAANLRVLAPGRYRPQTSIAYRLALVACGEATLAASFKGAGDWDYGGGHALVRAMSGELFNQDGEVVHYAPDGASKGRGCFGGAPSVARDIASRDWRSLLWAPHSPPDYPGPLEFSRGWAIANPALLQRAQGCLLGQLAGDALGSLVEFQSAAEIYEAYPDGIRDLVDGGTWNTIAGQPTDDSELALLLGRSIVASGGYRAEAVAEVYGYWYTTHPFGMGDTTRRALQPVAAHLLEAPGRSLAEVATASASRSSQANGSLMRASPLGIWGHALDAAQLAAAARLDSQLTHPHLICQDACAVFTVAIAHAIHTGEAPAAVYQYALDWGRQSRLEPGVLEAMEQAASAPPTVRPGTEGWVLVALQNAFYQLIHATGVEDGISTTVQAGGDTDTNAAIAGALLGAVYGRPAVPQQWQSLILTCRPLAGVPGVRRPRPEPCWPVDALVLAERLLLAGL